MLAGSSRLVSANPLKAELLVKLGFRAVVGERIDISIIFTNICTLKQVLNSNYNVVDWKMNQMIDNFRRFYNFNCISVKVILHDWNSLGDHFVA